MNYERVVAKNSTNKFPQESQLKAMILSRVSFEVLAIHVADQEVENRQIHQIQQTWTVIVRLFPSYLKE